MSASLMLGYQQEGRRTKGIHPKDSLRWSRFFIMMLNNNQLLFQGLSQKAHENAMVGDDETLEKTGKVKIYFLWSWLIFVNLQVHPPMAVISSEAMMLRYFQQVEAEVESMRITIRYAIRYTKVPSTMMTVNSFLGTYFQYLSVLQIIGYSSFLNEYKKSLIEWIHKLWTVCWKVLQVKP